MNTYQRLTDGQKVHMSLTTGFLFKYNESDSSHGLDKVMQLPSHVRYDWHQRVAEFVTANDISDKNVTAWVGHLALLAEMRYETELAHIVAIAMATILVKTGHQGVLEESLEILNYLVWRNFMEP